MSLRAAVLFAALLAAAPAGATGTITCSIADTSLTLTFEGVFRQGLGEGLAQARGEATPTLKLLAPGFGPLAIARENVTQFWMHGSSLKLRLYLERASEPNSTLELVIETRQEGRDETAFSGTYQGKASHFDAAKGPEAKETTFRGRVDCQAG